MRKIFIRSPFFKVIDVPAERSKVILKLYIWNDGQTEPIEPNYVIEKFVPSPTSRTLSFNISNFAKEFINPEKPCQEANFIENPNAWCFMKLEYLFIEGTVIETSDFVCLNGFTDYLGGYNQSNDDRIFPMFNTNINYNHNNCVNFWIGQGEDMKWNGVTFTPENKVYKFTLIDGDNILEYSSGVVFKTIKSLRQCEPIYTPVRCQFINRFGGWDTMMLNKAKTENLSIESKDFEMMQDNVNYNPIIGQRQVFNIQGNKSIKINTGFVDENYSELLENLMTSPKVLLDNMPAILKTKNLEYKTRLKDKNINYELEFEYNFGFINDVI
jgi:hypothetical protein